MRKRCLYSRHAVPFPSNFHLDHKVRNPFLFEQIKRPILVSYIGGSSSDSPFTSRMRGEMLTYCKQHSSACKRAHYSKSNERDPNLNEEADNPQYKVYLRSVFCLQPIGDLPTRKGLFDGIMFGCIPVVFHPLSASAMYTWHWSTQLWKEIVVEIPMNVMDPSKPVLLSDPIQYLKHMMETEPEKVAHRQKLLRRHAFELSYSLEFYQAGNSTNWPLDEKGQPLRDAYDISMDHILGLHSGKLVEEPLVVDAIWREEMKIAVAEKYSNEFFAALKPNVSREGKHAGAN